MAHIAKRTTARGEDRWDVGWRVHGQVRRQTFRTRGAAEAHKRKVEGDELGGQIIDPRSGRATFEDYSRSWMTTRLVKGRPLTANTKQGYEGLLRRNILPIFGSAQLATIRPEAVRAWHAELVAAAGADQAAKSYRLLRAVMNTAVEDLRIGRNPCRVRGAGIERTQERPMIDASTVLAIAGAIDDRLRSLVLLAGFGGLRTGEILALTRADVDPHRRTVRIRATKTDAGVRSVALPRQVVEAIEEHVERWAQPGSAGLVFTSPRGGPLRRAEISKAWRRAVADVGAPEGLHVHDLRHHAATSVARLPGVTTKELMARLGHSSPRAALIYQHATAERDLAIADSLDAQIAAARSGAVASIDRARKSSRKAAAGA